MELENDNRGRDLKKICPFDAFEKGRYLYTFENICNIEKVWSKASNKVLWSGFCTKRFWCER